MDDAELARRLRELADREVTSMPSGWEDAYTLYSYVADRIEALIAERDRQYDENVHRIAEQARPDFSPAAVRDATLEEAARIAETLGVPPQLNVWGGGPDWFKHGQNIAARIRAQKNSSAGHTVLGQASAEEAPKVSAASNFSLMSKLSATEAERAALANALEALLHAVCGDTGFAECVRRDTGKAYPWPALKAAEKQALDALKRSTSRPEG